MHEGIKYEYLIFLDGNTIKQTLLSQSETDEPSGTRVVVQIKQEWQEKTKWIEAIKEQSQYFDGALISIDGKVEKVEVKKDLLWTSSIDSDWLHFILGCVYYEIDWKQFSKWKFLSPIRGGLHIGLNEGIIPNPSRETILLNQESISKIELKFQKIADIIYQECEAVLTEVKKKKEILRLQFINENKITTSVGEYSFGTYREICSALGKTFTIIEDPRYNGYGSWTYRIIKDSFTVNRPIQVYREQPVYYTDKWTELKRQFLREQEFYNIAQKNKKEWSLFHTISITIPEDVVDKTSYARAFCDNLKTRLIKEYIEENFVLFPEEEFLVWKKGRKKEKKERGKGITYYRARINAESLCTEDKGDIDLGQYPCLFKATKDTAQIYWRLLNKIYNTKMLITKSEGYNLDKLEASPFLKRMCTEALKIEVFNIIGDNLTYKTTLDLIEEINPLLAQYIEEIELKKVDNSLLWADTRKALIEAGELLGFNHEEVKLRYIQYHLNRLKLLGRLGNSRYSGVEYNESDKTLIKRYYILETLVEKKQLQVESVDENQLTLELEFSN